MFGMPKIPMFYSLQRLEKIKSGLCSGSKCMVDTINLIEIDTYLLYENQL